MNRLCPHPTIIALGWTILIVISLALPGSSIPQTDILQYDKIVHAVLFGVGVVLWLRVPWSHENARWAIVLCAVIFAPVSELIQSLIGEGRVGDPWDAVADVAGVVLGVGVWLFWRHRRGPTRSEPPGSGDQNA